MPGNANPPARRATPVDGHAISGQNQSVTFQAPADTERERGPESDALGGVLLIDLPTDRPRPLSPSGERGATEIELAGALDAPFLVAAFAALLHRYTGEESVVIGWTIEAGLAPLRLELGDEPTFAELAARAAAALAASAESDEPCGQVVLALDTELPGDAAPELGLSVRRQPAGALLRLTYSADIYEEDTAGRLLGHLQTIVAATAADPSIPVGAVPLLTEAEREQLLVEWNRTAAEYPDACLHDLVAEQARRSPTAVAVEDGQTQLTYAELDARANRLANYLRDLGVGPEALVGICVAALCEMLVGLLGILKAGGGVRPDRPDLSRRPAGVHARPTRRRRSSSRRSRCSAACPRTTARAWSASTATGRDRGMSDAPPEVETRPRAARVRHLHVGLDRERRRASRSRHRALVNFL